MTARERANELLDYCQVPGCLNKNIRKVAYCSVHMAAPDLLAACEAVSEWGLTQAKTDVEMQMVVDCRKAISKAKPPAPEAGR